jgi:hypothetical protein
MNLRKASMTNKVQTFKQVQAGVGASGVEMLDASTCESPKASRLKKSASKDFVRNLAGHFSRLFKG